MKTALVIMAAGMGSRFGGGIKQLEPVGPNGEIIMDYSIHDAIEAGFNKVVFIIRKDIRDAFHDAIGKRIEGICNELNIEFAYAYQELDDLPKGIEKPAKRSKPWGTGQAVLVCKDIIKEPFVVINADDYYGKEAFVKIHEFLVENYTPEKSKELCMAGFILGNTLSDNGTVTRGICAVDENDYLTDVVETYEIKKTSDGAESQGNRIDVNSHVSMNMWGLTPEFVGLLEEGFVREIISKVQTMRKEAGFEVMDKIAVSYEGTEKAEKVFADNASTIADETLALEVTKAVPAGYTKEWKINGEAVTIGVEKR